MAKQIDILCSESSLYNAWNIVKAKGAAEGIDGVSIQEFEKEKRKEIPSIYPLCTIRSLTYWYDYRAKSFAKNEYLCTRWNQWNWWVIFARVQLATNSQIICELLKLIIAADYQPLAILEPSKTQHLPKKNRGICEKTRQDRINCWEYGI